MQSDVLSLLEKTGRLRKKGKQTLDPLRLTELPHKGMAFVYQRLSRQEQVENSIWSLKAQDALYNLAKEHGYPEELIYIEKRDLGISGTLNQDKREGLAYLIGSVKQDKVESVYIIHISRLYRDQTLINAYALGEFLKEHNVILVTPTMRLNLRDKMHMKIYRMEVERAADELDMMVERLGGAKLMKAKAGFYVGGAISTGCILDTDEYLPNGDRNPNCGKTKPYEPHAIIIEEIFRRLYREDISPFLLAHRFREEGKFIPEFGEKEREIMKGRTALNRVKRVPGGYAITASLIRSVATNPVYIGWWIYNGQIVSTNNHPRLVDDEIFWAVQEKLNHGYKPRGRAKFSEPLPLTGLLYCEHNGKTRPVHSHPARGYYSAAAEFDAGLEQNPCFYVPHYVLDGPISEVILRECSFSNYANEVLNNLEEQCKHQEDWAYRVAREYKRLEGEVEGLVRNLAYAKTPEQAQWIYDAIEERKRVLVQYSRLEIKPRSKTLTLQEISLVKEFLSDIPKYWDIMPNKLKNQFLRLFLESVMVSYDKANLVFKAHIYWATGREQEVFIYRPKGSTWAHWTLEEEAKLKELWAYASPKEILATFPEKSWIAIRGKANRMGLKRLTKEKITKNSKRWAPMEIELLRRCSQGEISEEEIALQTGRNIVAIKEKARRLKLPRNGPERQVCWQECVNMSFKQSAC